MGLFLETPIPTRTHDPCNMHGRGKGACPPHPSPPGVPREAMSQKAAQDGARPEADARHGTVKCPVPYSPFRRRPWLVPTGSQSLTSCVPSGALGLRCMAWQTAHSRTQLRGAVPTAGVGGLCVLKHEFIFLPLPPIRMLTLYPVSSLYRGARYRKRGCLWHGLIHIWYSSYTNPLTPGLPILM